MNTVIPISNDRIASHFTKAESFIFIDPQGKKISTHANPAINNQDCSAKKMIVELFKTENVKRVIVRNIGQRSLGRLLGNDMLVFKSDVNNIDNATLLNDTHSSITALTTVEQGRISENFEKKGGECGCNGKSAEQKSCASHEPGTQHSKKDKRCCEQQGDKDQSQSKKHGKGKCCH